MGYKTKLEETLDKLPTNVAALFGDSSLDEIIQDIGSFFDLTMGETEEIKELVRQVVTKEREPKDFEAGLLEKLDEENREKAPDLVAVLSEKIFSKLLPALNIKIPIELAVRAAAPKVEGLEEAPLAPAHSAKLKRMAPPAVPPAPVKGSLLRQAYEARMARQGPSLMNSGQKPPLMETSHESLSLNPLQSLVQMLEGKVSQKDMVRQFEKLPLQLKTALRSVDSAKKVVDIGRKYALHMDKLGELGAETGMVILGFTHPGQFLSRLTRRLGLPEEKVRPIAQEINTEVFLKIREALKQINGEVGPDTSEVRVSGVATESRSREAAERPIPKVTPMEPEPPAEGTAPGLTLQSEEEETLDREAILRDIENPTPVRFAPQSGIPLKPEKVATEPVLPKEIPAQSIRVAESVPYTSPTTPKIPARPEIKASTPVPIAPALEKTPYPGPLPSVAASPVSEPQTTPPKPQSIIDQKLAGATTSTKSESNYTTDPYRETAE